MTKWNRLTPDDVGKDGDEIPSGYIQNLSIDTLSAITQPSISLSDTILKNSPSISSFTKSDILGLWCFEEGFESPSMAYDWSNNNYNASFNDDCSFAELERDGLKEYTVQSSGSGYLEVPHESTLYPDNASLHAAFNLNSLGGYQFTAGNGAFGLYSSVGDYNDKILGYVVIGGTNYFVQGPVPNTGEWYHVTVTYDGSELKLYVGNELYNTNNNMSGVIDKPTDPFFISDSHDGYVDDVVYMNKSVDVNVVRTLTQLSANHKFSNLPTINNPSNFYVDSSGNIGFNNMSPSVQFDFNGTLHINNASGGNRFRLYEDGSGQARLRISSGGYIESSNTDFMEFDAIAPKLLLHQKINMSSNNIENVNRVDTTEGITNPVSRKTSNYTATIGETLLCDAAFGGFTITLPSSPTSGGEIDIKKTSGGGNTVTIDGNGNNIDGNSQYYLTNENESITVISDGSNWFII